MREQAQVAQAQMAAPQHNKPSSTNSSIQALQPPLQVNVTVLLMAPNL